MGLAFFTRTGKGEHPCPHTHTSCSTWNFLFLPCSFPWAPTRLSSATSAHHPHRKPSAILVCSLPLTGGPASCTSSWPSSPPGLLLSLCPQRLAGPTQSLRQKLGSPLVCRKSRAVATSRTTRLASRSLKCFCFWMWARMEPGGQRRHIVMPFWALGSITSQRPVFTSLGWGLRLIYH